MKAPVPWCTWCGREKCSCETPVENVEYNPEPRLRDRVVAIVKRMPECFMSDITDALDVHFVERDEDIEMRREYDCVINVVCRLARAGYLKAVGRPAQYTLIQEPKRAEPKERAPRKRRRSVPKVSAERMQRARERTKRLYDARVEANQCTRCGCALAEFEDWDRQACPSCYERRLEIDKKYQASEKAKETARARGRRLYAAKREQMARTVRERRAYLLSMGICRCGLNDVKPGTQQCQPCLDKQRGRSRAAMKSIYDRRRAEGLCFRCGEWSGEKVNCVKCREKRRSA